ncbi:MAG: hypothetical protein HYS27_22700 [Deltaproteobacteria bacterium]|nr:hypothetical protein [Deltaproteobacteria bacterium]
MERRTNIDVEELAGSPLVRSFMLRVLPEVSDPLTGYVFAVSLAKRAADAFDLYHDDGVIFAAALVEVAADVIATRATPPRAAALCADRAAQSRRR